MASIPVIQHNMSFSSALADCCKVNINRQKPYLLPSSSRSQLLHVVVAKAASTSPSSPSSSATADNGSKDEFAASTKRITGNGTPYFRLRESRMIPIDDALKREDSQVTMSNVTKRHEVGSMANISAGKTNSDKVTVLPFKKQDTLVLRNQVSKKAMQTSLDVFGFEDNIKVLPSDESFSWSNESYSTLSRSIDIWSFVLSLRARIYFDDAKWSYFGGFSEEKQKTRRRKTASFVRDQFLQLGPTFIKLGQVSSTRSDLFPVEFVEDLAKLQDRVPAFSKDKAIASIEKELGQPLDELFMLFEEQPIAAASLGQVHRAILLNGEKVVVKVQRPGLKELFDIDLKNLKKVAEFFQNSEKLGGPTRDWMGIYDEFSTILYKEIDYINEGRNADRFRRDFRNVKWVRVPQIFWDYTTQKILTLEYVPGIKINEVSVLEEKGFDRSLISRRPVEAYLIQILRTGFFHADPHPGNLAIDVDGSLIYYDFGMMGEIKSFTREKLLELFYATYEKDAKKVVQALIDLEAVRPTGDMSAVRRSIQFFLDNLMNQLPDESTTLSAIGQDLFAIALDQPFRFPATFTFVVRAFLTLEGVGYILDPEFKFAKVASPFAQELLDVKNTQGNGSYFIQEFQRQANDARDAAVAMPMRIQRIDQLLQQLEAGDLKLRVRVLEAERAAKRASILQMTTIHAIAAGTLLNVGVSLNAQGLEPFAISSFIGSGIFALLLTIGMKRIDSLDKLEQKI